MGRIIQLILLAIGLAGCQPSSPSPASLTYCEDVAPILFEHCAACHRPGESAPFDLLTYADAKKRAEQIRDVTASRFMPPWLPEPRHEPFIGERRLSQSQIDTIDRWVQQGAVQGDPADLPPPPEFTSGWQLGQPDLVVNMPLPYTLGADGTDVFRNFVFPSSVKGRRWIRAVEIRPGNKRIVHHAGLRIDRTPASRGLDGLDPEPGYNGMLEDGAAQMPDGHFLGWTPGKLPFELPDHLAWRLEKNTDLVMQLHMLPSGKPEQIQSMIGLYFAKQPATRQPFMIRIGPKDFVIPAGEKEFVIESEYILPVDVEVLGIYPHAHYLATQMLGIATLPSGTKNVLIEIKDWDFNWQDEYRYARPISLPRGTSISMRYSYDNSADNVRNPHQPPRRVVYGPRSTDEMGDLWIQVLPKNREALAVLVNDFQPRELRVLIARYQHAIRVNPDDALAHNNLASFYQRQGNLEQASIQYEQVIRIQPDNSQPYNDLGSVQARLGNLGSAESRFREALRLDSDFAKAHNNLGTLFARQKKFAEAKIHFERAVEIDPDSGLAHNNLGLLHDNLGNTHRAINHYRHAVRINPGDAAAYNSLGSTLARAGELREAISCFQQALEIQPDYSAANDNLIKARRLMDNE